MKLTSTKSNAGKIKMVPFLKYFLSNKEDTVELWTFYFKISWKKKTRKKSKANQTELRRKEIITLLLLIVDSKFTNANGTSDRSLIVESADGDCCCCLVPTCGEECMEERDGRYLVRELVREKSLKTSLDWVFIFNKLLSIYHSSIYFSKI